MMIPDVVYRPATLARRALTASLPVQQRASALQMLEERREQSVMDGLKGLFVRFKDMLVIDNHRGILWADLDADVYPIILVTNDRSTNPIEFRVERVFNGIADGDKLPITNGLDVGRSFGQVPRFLDIHVALMRSKEAQRDLWKGVTDALNSEEGKSLVGTIQTAVTSANPVAGVIISAGAALLSLVSNFLSKEEDEQIFYGVASFEDDPDGLGIGKPHVLTDSKNARVMFEVVGQYR